MADVFDSLTADRPYRKAMGIDEALRIMSKEVGTAFDPTCLNALVAALDQTKIAAA